jgi:hypothetical protein
MSLFSLSSQKGIHIGILDDRDLNSIFLSPNGMTSLPAFMNVNQLAQKLLGACVHTYTDKTMIKTSNQLTPWSLVLLEKPPVALLLNNFPTFFGTKVSLPCSYKNN